MKVIIADLGVGNLFSLRKGLERVGAKVEASHEPRAWLEAPALVLPGVGAFGAGMRALAPVSEELALRLRAGIPALGVCLGMQLLFESSDESPGVPGLGLVAGRVRRLTPTTGAKVPHMGWTRIAAEADPLFEGVPASAYGYFVHSYAADAAVPGTIATAQAAAPFAAAVRRGNVVGTQFHPEKSGEVGLRILANWLREAEAAA